MRLRNTRMRTHRRVLLLKWLRPTQTPITQATASWTHPAAPCANSVRSALVIHSQADILKQGYVVDGLRKALFDMHSLVHFQST